MRIQAKTHNKSLYRTAIPLRHRGGSLPSADVRATRWPSSVWSRQNRNLRLIRRPLGLLAR